MGGVVEPEDLASWDGAILVLAVLLAIAFVVLIIWFLVSTTNDIRSGGLRKLRHEWVASEIDCQYGTCWRKVALYVLLEPIAPGGRSHRIYLCQECADAHYPNLDQHYLSASEVAEWQKMRRAESRKARIEKQKAHRASLYK
jgi:hypothetical protein